MPIDDKLLCKVPGAAPLSRSREIAVVPVDDARNFARKRDPGIVGVASLASNALAGDGDLRGGSSWDPRCILPGLVFPLTCALEVSLPAVTFLAVGFASDTSAGTDSDRGQAANDLAPFLRPTPSGAFNMLSRNRDCKSSTC